MSDIDDAVSKPVLKLTAKSKVIAAIVGTVVAGALWLAHQYGITFLDNAGAEIQAGLHDQLVSPTTAQ